ncbi:MAG: N-acetylglucosamine kinase, partial [Bacteroidetes bacterium]|nr:N-acetylglucosamine kinase [Bacteroidota bacterium]
MILIVDSGSTKADWMYVDGGDPSDVINTIGFNPFYHKHELIVEKLNESKELLEVADKI